MKKIFTLIAFIIITNKIFAAAGDTTVVPAHIYDSLTYYGNYSHQINLPNVNATYRKIFFQYTIGKYQCPAGSQYCGQWDYSLYFIAKPLNPSISTDEFEIARGITPYALTGTYFPWAWTHTYTIDVTDFAPILKDSTQFRALYSGYSGGFTLASKFIFVEGIPAREAVSVDKVQKGYYNYGNATTSIETNLVPDTTQILAPATHADLLVNITGHGSDNNGCSEFCQRYYTIALNGINIAQKDIWKKCGFADIQAQTGTWPYDRGNWCPGEKVLANRHKLNGITPGVPFVVDMDIENYNTSTGGAGYSIANYIIAYKNPAHSLDAELVEIIAPSITPDYKKYNGGCVTPIIKLKNSGSDILANVEVHYGYKGYPNNVYTYSGNLVSMADTIINLPPVPFTSIVADSATFYAIITTANGVKDNYQANDSLISLYRNAPTLPSNLIIRTQTNNTAVTSGGTVNETSWNLYDATGALVKARVNNANSTAYLDTLQLAGGCYTLEIIDGGWEDGINFWYYPNYPTNPGNGSILFRNGLTGTTLTNTVTRFNSKYYGGDFGSKVIYNFKVDFATNNSNIQPTEFECNVLPNPAKDFALVELLGTKNDASVLLVDYMGRVLQTQAMPKNNLLKLNTSTLPVGIYFVKVVCNNATVVKKLEVVR